MLERALCLTVLATASLYACNASPPEPVASAERVNGQSAANAAPTSTTHAEKAPTGSQADHGKGHGDKGGHDKGGHAGRAKQLGPGGGRKVSAKPTATVPASPDDPLAGKWTLADATQGLPASGALTATLETDMGTISCKLFDDKAPITVANFVGLARGTRPWKTPDGTWQKKPAYDGTPFHRIIKGFMIQGGDAKKNGSGEAGYVIPDEIWEDANHDRAGLLCMANRGPNTNSAQFFITDAAAAHLDNNYTIFGECSPLAVVHKIAETPVRGDRPDTAPVIKKVTISRK